MRLQVAYISNDLTLQKMQQSLKWIDAWDLELRRKIAAIQSKVKSDISLLKQRLKKKADASIVQLIKLKQNTCKEAVKRLRKSYLSDSTFNGLRMTIHSTIKLAQRLLDEESFEFVLTRKMNQDPLEVSIKNFWDFFQSPLYYA